MGGGESGKVSSCGPVDMKPSQPRPRTEPLLLRKCAAGSQDSLRLPPLSDVRTVRRRLHAGEDDIPPRETRYCQVRCLSGQDICVCFH